MNHIHTDPVFQSSSSSLAHPETAAVLSTHSHFPFERFHQEVYGHIPFRHILAPSLLAILAIVLEIFSGTASFGGL